MQFAQSLLPAVENISDTIDWNAIERRAYAEGVTWLATIAGSAADWYDAETRAEEAKEEALAECRKTLDSLIAAMRGAEANIIAAKALIESDGASEAILDDAFKVLEQAETIIGEARHDAEQF